MEIKDDAIATSATAISRVLSLAPPPACSTVFSDVELSATASHSDPHLFQRALQPAAPCLETGSLLGEDRICMPFVTFK